MPLSDHHPALTFLSASSTGFGSSGASLGRAVHACPALRKLVLEDNKIDDEGGVALCDAFAAQAELVDLNLAFNEISALPIECQLRLAQKMSSPTALLDLSGNVLSSPPLAHRAAPQMLSDYLRLLAAEPHPLERLRLMVVGFGGVGKTTFCGAVTCPSNERGTYHASLSHCSTWDSRMMASWARGLMAQRGHAWAEKVAAVLTENSICGADRPSVLQSTEPGGGGLGGGVELRPVAEGLGALLGTVECPGTDFGPSPRLDALGSAGRLDPREDLPRMQVLTTAPHPPLPLPHRWTRPARVPAARPRHRLAASEGLLLDGAVKVEDLPCMHVLTTAPLLPLPSPQVGAVKVEGSLQLPMPDYGGPISTRECSLVDFAGQMEYLVSHQLLLASMHTLCVLIQPLGSCACMCSPRRPISLPPFPTGASSSNRSARLQMRPTAGTAAGGTGCSS